MMEDPTTKIARPRQIYTGPTVRDYVPIEKQVLRTSAAGSPGEIRRREMSPAAAAGEIPAEGCLPEEQRERFAAVKCLRRSSGKDSPP